MILLLILQSLHYLHVITISGYVFSVCIDNGNIPSEEEYDSVAKKIAIETNLDTKNGLPQ